MRSSCPSKARNHVLLESEPAWRQFIEALNDFLPAGPPSRLDILTARENEVLELLARGLDNEAIAKQLGSSPKTVRNQVSTIFSKLEVKSRVTSGHDGTVGRCPPFPQ